MCDNSKKPEPVASESPALPGKNSGSTVSIRLAMVQIVEIRVCFFLNQHLILRRNYPL